MQSKLINRISEDLLIPTNILNFLIRTSPYRYKKYNIPKRNGRGLRKIAQPAREVKRLQRWVIESILSRYKVHQSAMAYVKKKGIAKNARAHRTNPCILKLDFTNFFPSITDEDVKSFFTQSDEHFDTVDAECLASILCWAPTRSSTKCLAIGAPSSPMLTNNILYRFDCETHSICKEKDIVYTRYADDITLSADSKDILLETKEKITRILHAMERPKLHLNEEKTVFAMKPFRRHITGVYITNDDKLSLGRERKRLIRSQVHHYKNDEYNEEQIEKLRGMIAFSRDIEPEFVNRLESKYGELFR